MNPERLSILDLVDGLIADARSGRVSLPIFDRKTELCEIWHELSFCITSSQERTRRALSAAAVLTAGFDRIAASVTPLSAIRALLAAGFVSLRFMNRKTEHLAASWSAMIKHSDVLACIDKQFDQPSDARSFLIENFPGLGPKQASMLLRNIGFGSDLAIIDSHVARMSSIILSCDPTVEGYFATESRLRNFALERDVTVETLDVILWSCARMMRPSHMQERLLV